MICLPRLGGVASVEAYLSRLLPAAYSAATRSIWYSPVDQSVSGYVKPILPSLTFIVVQDAGHLVPKTQPAAALDMLTHLLTNTPFPTSNTPEHSHSPHASSSARTPNAASSAVNSTRSASRALPHRHFVYDGNLPTSTRARREP